MGHVLRVPRPKHTRHFLQNKKSLHLFTTDFRSEFNGVSFNFHEFCPPEICNQGLTCPFQYCPFKAFKQEDKPLLCQTMDFLKPLPKGQSVGNFDKHALMHAKIFKNEISRHLDEFCNNEMTPPELIRKITYEGSIYCTRVGRDWAAHFAESSSEEEEEEETKEESSDSESSEDDQMDARWP